MIPSLARHSTVTVTLDVKTVLPDLDADGDVDQSDYGLFQACYSGTGVIATSGCQMADFDGDNDVDGEDRTVFIGCASGPNVTADNTCDDAYE